MTYDSEPIFEAPTTPQLVNLTECQPALTEALKAVEAVVQAAQKLRKSRQALLLESGGNK